MMACKTKHNGSLEPWWAFWRFWFQNLWPKSSKFD